MQSVSMFYSAWVPNTNILEIENTDSISRNTNIVRCEGNRSDVLDKLQRSWDALDNLEYDGYVVDDVCRYGTNALCITATVESWEMTIPFWDMAMKITLSLSVDDGAMI